MQICQISMFQLIMGWCFSSYWVEIKGIWRIEKNWALENLAGWGLDNLTIGGFKVHSWGLRQMVCLAFISTACDDDDMDNMNDMDDKIFGQNSLLVIFGQFFFGNF